MVSIEANYFEQLEETLVYQRLTNGLELYIVPKASHHTVHAVLSVDVGSINQRLRHCDTNEEVVIPAGVAHFLEHKMFEDMSGEDISPLFIDQGATVNACTSHTQTHYFFSASMNVETNLLTLLHLVQEAHFTPASVAREKGIIQQELWMYEDDPYAKGYQQLLRGLYPNHPVSDDILGTVETINAMTFEDLQLCFETFYRPNQMRLIVVGNVEPQSIIEKLETQGVMKPLPSSQWERVMPACWEAPSQEATLYLDVTQPIVMLGLRLSPLSPTGTQLESYWLLDILAELLLGPTSYNYTKWYQAQLLDASFVTNTIATPFMHHMTLEAATDSPQALLASWQEVLVNWYEQPDMNERHFETIMRGRIGDFLRELDNLEGIATELAECLQYGDTYFEAFDFLRALKYSDVVDYAHRYLAQSSLSWVTILPVNEQKI